MADVLKELRAKEKELEIALSENSVFKNLEAIRSTIALFQNGSSENGHQTEFQPSVVPKEYNDGLSWREKILVALNTLKLAAPVHVVAELKRLGETKDDDFLQKRVSVMLSYMKRKKIVGSKTVGGKTKYFIK